MVSINHLFGSPGTVNPPYQLENGGTLPRFEFPDAGQGPALKKDLLRVASSGELFACTGTGVL